MRKCEESLESSALLVPRWAPVGFRQHVDCRHAVFFLYSAFCAKIFTQPIVSYNAIPYCLIGINPPLGAAKNECTYTAINTKWNWIFIRITTLNIHTQEIALLQEILHNDACWKASILFFDRSLSYRTLCSSGSKRAVGQAWSVFWAKTSDARLCDRRCHVKWAQSHFMKIRNSTLPGTHVGQFYLSDLCSASLLYQVISVFSVVLLLYLKIMLLQG